MNVLKKKQLNEQAGGHVKNAVAATSFTGLFLASQMAAALPDIDLTEFETWLETGVTVALMGIGMVILGVYVIPPVFGYIKRIF